MSPLTVPVKRSAAAAPVDGLIRVALPRDSRRIARLIDLANRAHALSPSYIAWLSGSPTDRVREIEHLVRAPVRTWLHWSVFWVAEREGRVVAALACFEAALVARPTLTLALEQIGWDGDRVAALHERTDARRPPTPPHPADIWTIEHVAALPEARGRGLVGDLVAHAISEGASAGFSQVGVDVRCDNVDAVRLFERAGFTTAVRYPHRGPGLPRGYRGMVRMCRPCP